MKRVSLFFCLLITILFTHRFSAGSQITVSGQVTDTSGFLVDSAEVSFDFWDYRDSVFRIEQITSDRLARFQFSFPEENLDSFIHVTFRKPGYFPRSQKFQLKERLRLELQLTPEVEQPVVIEDEGPIVVDGTVKDYYTRKPVPRVLINYNVSEENSEVERKSDTTRPSGAFAFQLDRSLSQNLITLEMSKPNYVPIRQAQKVGKGGELHFYLVPDSPPKTVVERLRPAFLFGAAAGGAFAVFDDRVDSSWPWATGKWILVSASSASLVAFIVSYWF